MNIELSLEAVAPPVGRARLRMTSGDPETPGSQLSWVPFMGWLGLLRTLSDLMAAAQAPLVPIEQDSSVARRLQPRERDPSRPTGPAATR